MRTYLLLLLIGWVSLISSSVLNSPNIATATPADMCKNPPCAGQDDDPEPQPEPINPPPKPKARDRETLYSDTIIHYYNFGPRERIEAGVIVTGMISGCVGGAVVTGPIGGPGCIPAAQMAGAGALGAAALKRLQEGHGYGAKGDDLVYPNYSLKGLDCRIDRVSLQLVDRNGDVLDKGRDTKKEFNFVTSIGAGITKSNEGTNNGEVGVHWWYDMGAAVRYIVVYEVSSTGSQCYF